MKIRRRSTEEEQEEDPYAAAIWTKSEVRIEVLWPCQMWHTLQSESTSFKGAIGRLLLEQRGTTSTRWTNVNGDIKIPSILLLLLPSLTQPPRSSGPAEKRQSISCRPTAGRNPLVTDTTILPVMNSYVFWSYWVSVQLYIVMFVLKVSSMMIRKIKKT